MGKKNKKAKSAVADSETGMPRHLRREILTIANELLEKCSLPFGSRSTEWNDFLDVYQVVEKLRKKQQNYVLHHDDRDESMSGFVSWLHANKIDTSAVAIADFGENGYGLKAARDVKVNELFMTIPRKLMLTTQTARNSILGPLIAEDRILQSMPNVVMALHVLCEFSQQDSFWTPYLKFLPKSYSTGLYFNPDEIQLLKASPTLSDILNQFRNITRQYSYFFRLFQGHPEASKLPIKNLCFDDYRWAVSTVMTRQNQIPSSGSGDDEMDTALIPLWDMCNHTNGQITTDFNRDLDRSECLSLRDFQKNEEVLIFYGPRSNAELMLHSGFVYDGNEFDRLALRVGVSKNDTLYSMKAEVLARIPLNSNCTFYLHADALNPVDSDLLAYLRVFSMDHATLFEHMFGDGSSERQQNLKEFLKPVSKANEIKAWSFLETRAQILLRAYPTTLQEDDEILLKGGLSENSRLAVKLRRCEKRILLNVVEYCGTQKERVLEHFFANDDGLVSGSHGEERASQCPCAKFSEAHIHHDSGSNGDRNDKGDDGGQGIIGSDGGGEIAGNEKGDFETVALESSKLENGIEERESEPERLSADCSDRSADAAAAAAADN